MWVSLASGGLFRGLMSCWLGLRYVLVDIYLLFSLFLIITFYDWFGVVFGVGLGECGSFGFWVGWVNLLSDLGGFGVWNLGDFPVSWQFRDG